MNKQNWGGTRKGAGRTPLNDREKKKGAKIYLTDEIKENILKYGIGDNFSEKAVELVTSEIIYRKKKTNY